MPKAVDLTGKTFFRLTVISLLEKRLNRQRVYLCRCSCGNIVEARSNCLTNFNKKSCGCLFFDSLKTHGKTKTPEYKTWAAMKQRCLNKKDTNYHNYGGRGISICKRWMNFQFFLEDMGTRPGPNYSIDRINNQGNYEPSNCRWATAREQSTNRRKTRFHKKGYGFNGKRWWIHVGYGVIKYAKTQEEAIEIRLEAIKNRTYDRSI